MQAYGVTSGAVDLNHFMYSSIASKCRKENLSAILECYYSTFASVLCGSKTPMPLTLPQFRKEFHAKNVIGLVMAAMMVPFLLLDKEDAPNLEEFMGDEAEEASIKHGKMLIERMRVNPLFKPRLLDSFDELKEFGVFNSSKVTSMIRQFSLND